MGCLLPTKCSLLLGCLLSILGSLIFNNIDLLLEGVIWRSDFFTFRRLFQLVIFANFGCFVSN